MKHLFKVLMLLLFVSIFQFAKQPISNMQAVMMIATFLAVRDTVEVLWENDSK